MSLVIKYLLHLYCATITCLHKGLSYMRKLTRHITNPANDTISIAVEDQPGVGGANHRYSITGFDTTTNPSKEDAQGYAASFSRQVLLFQNGPINECGVNGITHEVLLAVLIDRMERFQSGPYACRENALALTKLEEAMMWLEERTKGRVARGVEGTHEK